MTKPINIYTTHSVLKNYIEHNNTDFISIMSDESIEFTIGEYFEFVYGDGSVTTYCISAQEICLIDHFKKNRYPY